MKVFIPKETYPNESRVPMLPSDVEKLVKRGAEVEIEGGLGATCNFTDAHYENAGAKALRIARPVSHPRNLCSGCANRPWMR